MRTKLILGIILFFICKSVFSQQNNNFRGSWLGSRQIQAFSQCFDGLGNFLCGGDVTFPLTSNTIIAQDDVEVIFGDGADAFIKWISSGAPRLRIGLNSHLPAEKTRIQLFADDGAALTLRDFNEDALGPDYIALALSILSGFWIMDGGDGVTTILIQLPLNLYSATGTGNFASGIEFDSPFGGSGSPPNVDTSIFDIGDGWDILFNLKGIAIGTHPMTVSSNPLFNPVVGAFKMADAEVFTTIYHTPMFASSGGSVPSTNEVIIWNGTSLAGSSPAYGELYVSTPAGTNTTSGTPIKAAGTTTLGNASQFDMPANNRLRYTGSITTIFSCQANTSFVSSSNPIASIFMADNGTVDTTTEIASKIINGIDESSSSTGFIVELEQNEYVELWVDTNTGSPTVTFNHLNLRCSRLN